VLIPFSTGTLNLKRIGYALDSRGDSPEVRQQADSAEYEHNDRHQHEPIHAHHGIGTRVGDPVLVTHWRLARRVGRGAWGVVRGARAFLTGHHS